MQITEWIKEILTLQIQLSYPLYFVISIVSNEKYEHDPPQFHSSTETLPQKYHFLLYKHPCQLLGAFVEAHEA